jgi:hypothetical protein
VGGRHAILVALLVALLHCCIVGCSKHFEGLKWRRTQNGVYRFVDARVVLPHITIHVALLRSSA